MSLAMNAAPFHSNESNYSNNKEKKNNNKTIKNNSSLKVTNALSTLHSFNEEDDNLSNFTPLPPPSVQQKPQNEKNTFNPYKNNSIQENYNEKIDLNNLENNFLTPEKTNDYYKNLFSNSSKNNYYNSNQQLEQLESNNYSILLNKLNYMIHLLEENKDEKTNNVIEEVVLYSFLGIFIIFLVDSFTKVGKYVR